MKTMKIGLGIFALVLVAFGISLNSCQKDDVMMSGETYPIDISDDVTTVPADAIVLDWGIINMDPQTGPSCIYKFKLDKEVPPDAEETIDAPEDYDGSITFKVTGTKEYGYSIKISDDIAGFTAVIDAAYFKGAVDTYRKLTFEPGITSAGPLPAPQNAAGGAADISHTWFCYSLIEDENGNGCEWIGETAWAANGDKPGELRYVDRGNWATYVEYEAKTVNLYAGQTMLAGTVEFSAVDDGKVTIKIELNEGWRLELDEDGEVISEAVKIQGYNNPPPAENPSPGRFTFKGEELTVTVPHFNYYGVHLNLEWEDCPE